MKDELLYLQHIVDAYELIKEYTALGKDNFLENHMTQNAIIKVLSNITESAGHIEKETKEDYKQIPWVMIKSFRNILVHDYLGDVDYNLTWDIINKDLPQLVAVAQKILEEKYKFN